MKEIRKIIEEYKAIDHSKEKVALASVVNVEESSYRRIGARMLVRGSGVWVGGISGGCLEGDALKRSQQAIFKNQPSKVVYDILEDDKSQIGVGLGCNGRIEVLFTPIDPEDPGNPIEQLKNLVGIEHPAVVVKIIESTEISDLGKSEVIHEIPLKKDILGITMNDLNPLLSKAFDKKKPVIYDTTNVEGREEKLLVEFVRPETRLILVGTNYDVNSLATTGHELGWEIILVGKPKKYSKSTFSLAHNVLDYRDADKAVVNDYTAVVIMSHDIGWDKKMIPIFLDKKPGYIGLLGPRKRMFKIQDAINLNLESIKNFHAPVGLDIGAENPEEIGIAICSEIIAFFRGRSGQNLKLRKGTIHER